MFADLLKNSGVSKYFLLIALAAFILLAVSGPVFAQPTKIVVTTDRYAVWNPYYNDVGTSDSTFTAYALLLDEKGLPVANEEITFIIYTASDAKITLTATTNSNGIAYVSYDVRNKISSSSDSDAGQWTIVAYPTSYPNIKGSTQTWFTSKTGCKSNCHESGATDRGGNPKSPYNDNWGKSKTKAEEAHTVSGMMGGHDGRYCTDCHSGYDNEKGVYGLSGQNRPIGSHTAKYCDNCHRFGSETVDGMLDVYSARNAGGIPDMPSCYDCHPQKNSKVSPVQTTGSVGSYTGVSVYSWDRSNGPLVAHTASGNGVDDGVPCIFCHGPMHNITAPYPAGLGNSYTEDEQCLTCHTNQGKHSANNPIYCTACHSQDAHSIGVLDKNAGTQPTYTALGSTNAITKNDCESCHSPGKISDFFSTLKSYDSQAYTMDYNTLTDSFGKAISKHAGKVECTACHDDSDFHSITFLSSSGVYSTSKSGLADCYDCHSDSPARNTLVGRGYNPPYFSFQHGNAGYDGKNWDNYWNSDREACYYCHERSPHGDVRGNVTGLDVKADLSGKACAACHVKSYSGYMGNTMNPEPPAIDVNNTGKARNLAGKEWYNHTKYLDDYSDATCFGCHAPSPDFPRDFYAFVHGVDEGLKPGPDCASCHDLNERPPKRVDISAFSNSVHASLNSNAGNTAPVNPLSKACWACHGDGNEPMDHPDSYKNPKSCEDCHLTGNYGAPVVSEHTKNGLNVRVSKDCWSCHGIDVMQNANSDSEGSEKAFASHYAKTPDFSANINGVTGTDCYSCHQNTSTPFSSAMVNVNHTYMPDHGTKICWDCHGKDMHSGLQKPSISSDYCRSCHTGFEKHSGTVDCFVCHMDGSDTTYDSTKAQIHGIKFPSADGYSTSKSLGCYACHTGKLNESLSSWGVTAPKIPEFSHSNYPANGTRWGSYWNGPDSACTFCHTSDVHSTSVKGNVSLVKGSNSYRADLASSYWCSACHYSSYSGYRGDSLSPVPPDIATYSTPSDGIKWFDHSPYVSSDYTDAKCLECHGSDVSKSNEFVHAVKEGVGGACISCHTDPYYSDVPVNVSSFGRHGNLDGVTGVDDNDCRVCHYSPFEMLRSGWTTGTYSCEDCHSSSVPDDVRIANFRHGNNSCLDCHAGGGMDNGKLYHSDYSTPFGAVKEPGWNGWSKNVVDCSDCHVSHAKEAPFRAVGISSYMTFTSSCGGVNCHGAGNVHDAVKSQYIYPPFVRISIDRNMVLEGETVSVSADVWGYGVQINDSWYEVLDSRDNVVLSGKASPSDGSFGGLKNGYGYENVGFSFSANFDPGVYRIRVYAEKDTGVVGYSEAKLVVGAIGSTAANFEFETWNIDGTLTNWALSGSGTLEKSTNSKSGHSAKITTSSEARIESIKFPVESNKDYLVIVFANFSGKAGLTVKKWSNGALVETTPEVVAEGNPGRWIAFGTVVNSGNADSFSLMLRVYSGYAYFDNVSVVTVPLLENRAVNGEFEENEDSKYLYYDMDKENENVKAWEPKKENGILATLNDKGRNRVLAMIGTGYWTSAYQDSVFGQAARNYARDYGIRISGEFIAMVDIYKLGGNFGGLEFGFWDWDYGQNRNNLLEDGSYRVGFYDDTGQWRTVVVLDDMGNANLLQIKLRGENAQQLMFDDVRCYLNEGVIK
ncbi:multiheme c-type cytochrome [Geoglobus acetivorans]|uniref:Cytochrome c3 family protein n=1 Tax=Geoglobus acetivorans TaxID=565033 RepID=A0ABZ3H629_GEOAI|nr:hypothetical protein [Geoglobus acetivorans]